MLKDVVINRFLFNVIKKKVSKLLTIENSSSKFTKNRKTFSKRNKILEISEEDVVEYCDNNDIEFTANGDVFVEPT